MKYQRLIDRELELSKLFDEADSDLHMNEHYSLCSIFECETLKTYEKICEFAKENNFNKVYDIGCAFGHQSEVFFNNNVEYVGVNDHELPFWNKDKYKYIVSHYPFKIATGDSSLAVSVLCLTWNCYLHEGEKTLKQQCEALRRDFRQCLMYMAKDKVGFVSKYFINIKEIENDLYFLSN